MNIFSRGVDKTILSSLFDLKIGKTLLKKDPQLSVMLNWGETQEIKKLGAGYDRKLNPARHARRRGSSNEAPAGRRSGAPDSRH
jgi:hypothetical protein